jgi:hypothetical protein
MCPKKCSEVNNTATLYSYVVAVVRSIAHFDAKKYAAMPVTNFRVIIFQQLKSQQRRQKILKTIRR